MSLTVKELKKNYKLNEEQMKEIRDAMDVAQRAIEADVPGCQSHFEHKLANIVGALEGNNYVGEEFAEAYFRERKWVDVFLSFYGNDLKFRDLVEKWRKGAL